ncbi:MAG TPA: hypothetical protein PKE63_05645, partial [Lacibacter sp.]|nr:hypothetical protein [Lacibacter sp.]
GVWKGKIRNGLGAQRVELKLVKKGASLVGTSSYYESPNSYRRYAVKGYFNQRNNTVVWWDDLLLEEKKPRLQVPAPGELPLLAEADFNCPGAGIMMLEGKALGKSDGREKGPLHFDKTDRPLFRDEWDYILENYTTGGNDPALIDSVARIPLATRPPEVAPTPRPDPVQPVVVTAPPQNKPATDSLPVVSTAPVVLPQPSVPPAPAADIRDKFRERRNLLTTELPLAGDTIELHFYDNAEIDGDSISVFLNGELLACHIRLTEKPFVLKVPVAGLPEVSELVMVAENLGSIPPNTSYMIAWIDGKRYAANLESTEQTSAMIRLVKRRY